MKKKVWIGIALLLIIACLASFVACGETLTLEGLSGTSDGENAATRMTSSTLSSSSDASVVITEEAAAADELFAEVEEAEGDFVLQTEDGAYTQEGNVYTITAAGTYELSGSLEGQVVVDAADAEVVLELKGVTICYSEDSPIKIVAAEEVEISAKKETTNVIKDTRVEKTADDSAQGAGAIYAKCDLKIKGKGLLIVEAGYNNGIHTTKDLSIKNASVKVTAVNNAIKGKNSVTIESGTIVAISTKGDGIETEDTDVSSKGKQRGTVTIEDGTVTVYAAGDGVQAAYDFVMNGGVLTVYTGKYSSYTASTASTTSYKGVKVKNELLVNGGALYLYSYDDGLHADYGTALDNGESGLGNITISDGSVTIAVYSPTTATFGGRMGPKGGWGGQQSVSGSDAIHADNTLTISGGTITVDSAYEGLEGVNACTKITNSPSIVVSGGYLDVTVPTNGDTDGIDSNGTYTQTGGVVVVRGPGSAGGRTGGGAFALDTERGVSLGGGTLILFGGMENTPSLSGVTKTVCSTSSVSAGEHTVTVGDETYNVTLQYAVNGCVVYSGAGSATLR